MCDTGVGEALEDDRPNGLPEHTMGYNQDLCKCYSRRSRVAMAEIR
ncbi:hypothetical protein [Microcoleus sp. SVA1_A1]